MKKKTGIVKKNDNDEETSERLTGKKQQLAKNRKQQYSKSELYIYKGKQEYKEDDNTDEKIVSLTEKKIHR